MEHLDAAGLVQSRGGLAEDGRHEARHREVEGLLGRQAFTHKASDGVLLAVAETHRLAESGFMGLHIDIDQVAEDNREKQGKRKNGYLVNEGDRLTKEQKKELQEKN